MRPGPQHLRRIETLFDEALTRAPGERHRFLERESGGDQTLVAEVEALLTAHRRSGTSFLADLVDRAAEDLDLE